MKWCSRSRQREQLPSCTHSIVCFPIFLRDSIIDIVIVTCYTVGSMHGNAQSSERRVLDRCINPQYAWHSVTVVVLLLPLYSSFSVSPPPSLPPKQIIKLKEKGHRYVMSSV